VLKNAFQSFAAGSRVFGWIALVLFLHGCGGGANLRPWHTEFLSEEFTARMAEEGVRSFDDYLALEARLFKQLDEKVYAVTERGPAHALERYSAGSAADVDRAAKAARAAFPAFSQTKKEERLALLKSWGGVTIAYRRRLVDSPSYTLNHEEVQKALEGYTKIKMQAEDLDAYPASELMRRIRQYGLPAYAIYYPTSSPAGQR